jgi:hypothetical protein
MCPGRGGHVCCTLLAKVSMVEPQNHTTLWMAGFTEFGLKTRRCGFGMNQMRHMASSRMVRRDEAASCRVCPSDAYSRSLSILSPIKWMSFMYLGVVYTREITPINRWEGCCVQSSL